MAGTNSKMFFAKYDKTIGYSIIGVLLFLLGWQAGRVMSPYYASSPIVFEDRQPGDVLGTSEALESLISSPNPSSAPKAPQTDSRGLYVGSKNSTLFHYYTCASAKSIKVANQVWFATYDAATAAGRTPSACTQKLK